MRGEGSQGKVEVTGLRASSSLLISSFVPALPCPCLPPLPLQAAMSYIRQTYPDLWSRNQGRDHFLFLPEDLGACGLWDDPLVQAPIKLVHFGMQVRALLVPPSLSVLMHTCMCVGPVWLQSWERLSLARPPLPPGAQ